MMKTEDGYDLWLRYEPVASEHTPAYEKLLRRITLSCGEAGDAGTIRSALAELSRALPQLLGRDVPAECKALSPEMAPAMPPEGFWIHSRPEGEILIEAPHGTGILYGVFAFLRILQTGGSIANLSVADAPRMKRRMFNHWDNLDGSVERGYAGKSLWKWDELPEIVDGRYADYCRAAASVGINGSVLNNVNTQPEILSAEYLKKAAALADVFRNYGITVYLSVNFGSPRVLGGLPTADPCDPAVARWWNDKAAEIYALIPDFGGFLVKADSEGQPGPYAYGRTHADGANMLADALAPFGGVVIWRAFVYGQGETDRAKKAYADFKPLDGAFRPNALLQVKNGAIDFQPREPVHPLFGAMPRTKLCMEFQVTQEYLGQGNHLVFLAPLWKEVLDFENTAPALAGIAGVTNIGNNRDWCGSLFHPANWYAFGRLCWDYTLTSEEIAREWALMTWGDDPQVLEGTLHILLHSWDACVDYMTPLGLHHIMKYNHHYGPDPGCQEGLRDDWKPPYYHRADANGLGFDRTRTGSDAVDQYAGSVAERFNNLAACPEKYLLWFHHVPWEYHLSSGRTLKDELAFRYDRGVQEAEQLRAWWSALEGRVDAPRFKAVRDKLDIQVMDAKEWRDVCVPYFLGFCK